MKDRKNLSFLALAALLALGACIPVTGGQAISESMISTLAMETVSAQQTQALYETLIAVLSATPEPVVITQTPAPTNTVSVPTLQPPPTLVSNTPTPVPPTPTATNTPIPCNRATFVADISIPDGTKFAPGESFTKTWRLKNNGSCTWNPNYALVFASGDQMGAASVQAIGVTVKPGETVDISVRLTAPQKAATYTGSWQLRSDTGLVFGLGENAQKTFWVKIEVTPASASDDGLLYDFAASYCSAEWRSNSGTLDCPFSDASKGSFYRTYSPKFETGYQDNQATIVMVPANGEGGFISAKFPAIKVNDGDDFTTVIGCLDDSDSCDVMIQLNYSADGGPVKNLATWNQTSDGKIQDVLLDLNSLTGKSVQFILTVYNNGDSKDDRVFWLVPAVR